MPTPPIIHRHSRLLTLFIWALSRPLLLAFVALHRIGLLNTMRPRVRAVLKSGNYVLLVREVVDFNRWSVPGGGVKPDEPPQAALTREMKEELDLIIPEGSFKLTGTHTAKDIDAPHDIIVFEADVDDSQRIRLQYEILDAAWWELSDLPKNLSPGARAALQVHA